MNFEKIFKMIGFSLIVGLTVLMAVIAPVTAVSRSMEMKPMEFVEFDGDIHYPIVDEPVVVDTIAPVTRIKNQEQWQNQDVFVQMRAYDESGVAKTLYDVWMPSVENTCPIQEYTEGNQFTVSEEGEWKMAYFSIDNVGNVEERKVSMIRVDKTAPTTHFRIPASVNTKEITVDFSERSTDALSGIEYYTVSMDNGKSFTSVEKSITLNKEGTYTVQVAAVDMAGNVGNFITFTTALDFPSNSGPSGNTRYSPSYTPVQDQVYVLTDDDMARGFNVVLNENDVIKFTIENTEYTLSIAELVQYEKATFDVNEMSFDFVQRQSKLLEITGDDVEDIKLVVGNIEDDSVLVTISKYNKPVVVEDEVETESTPEANQPIVTENEEEENFFGKLSTPIKVGLGSLIILLLVSLLGFYIFRN